MATSELFEKLSIARDKLTGDLASQALIYELMENTVPEIAADPKEQKKLRAKVGKLFAKAPDTDREVDGVSVRERVRGVVGGGPGGTPSPGGYQGTLGSHRSGSGSGSSSSRRRRERERRDGEKGTGLLPLAGFLGTVGALGIAGTYAVYSNRDKLVEGAGNIAGVKEIKDAHAGLQKETLELLKKIIPDKVNNVKLDEDPFKADIALQIYIKEAIAQTDQLQEIRKDRDKRIQELKEKKPVPVVAPGAQGSCVAEAQTIKNQKEDMRKAITKFLSILDAQGVQARDLSQDPRLFEYLLNLGDKYSKDLKRSAVLERQGGKEVLDKEYQKGFLDGAKQAGTGGGVDCSKIIAENAANASTKEKWRTDYDNLRNQAGELLQIYLPINVVRNAFFPSDQDLTSSNTSREQWLQNSLANATAAYNPSQLVDRIKAIPRYDEVFEVREEEEPQACQTTEPSYMGDLRAAIYNLASAIFTAGDPALVDLGPSNDPAAADPKRIHWLNFLADQERKWRNDDMDARIAYAQAGDYFQARLQQAREEGENQCVLRQTPTGPSDLEQRLRDEKEQLERDLATSKATAQQAANEDTSKLLEKHSKELAAKDAAFQAEKQRAETAENARDNLQKTVDQKDESIIKYIAEIQTIKGRGAGAASQAQAEQAAKSAIQDQLRICTSQITKSAQEVQDKQKELNRVAEQKIKADRALAALQSTHAQLQNTHADEMKSLRDQLESMETRHKLDADRVIKEKNDATNRAAQLEDQLIKTIAAQEAGHQGQAPEWQQNINALNANLDELRGLLKAEQKNSQELRHTLENLTVEKNRLANYASGLEIDLEVKEAEAEFARQQAAEVEFHSQENTTEQTRLNNKLTFQLSEARGALGRHKATIATLRTSLASANEELDQYKDNVGINERLEECARAKLDLIANLDASRQAEEDCKTMAEDLRQSLDSKDVLISELEGKLEEKTNQLNGLEKVNEIARQPRRQPGRRVKTAEAAFRAGRGGRETIEFAQDVKVPTKRRSRTMPRKIN